MDIKQLKFNKIGEYLKINNEIVCSFTVKKTKRLSIVYMFSVDGKIMYIGKSIQGYSRPLSYHKNKVMASVRNGIIDACNKNKVVEVLIRKDDLEISFEGFKLDIIEAFEQSLIKSVKPSWNNHIQRD